MNRSTSQTDHPTAVAFDTQASDFDRRAGLPEVCCQQIAQALIQISGVEADDLWVELGCGTGQIGWWLIHSSVRYLGLDLSAQMLEIFRQRLQVDPLSGNWTLVRADADQRWPVEAGQARAIFSSRAIHLLDPDAVIREALRVAHPQGAVLLIGRIQRDPEGVKAQLQTQMQDLMRQRGWQPRQGKRVKETLLSRLCEQGAELIESRAVAHWPIEFAPIQSLHNWRGKVGLGGIDDLPHPEKDSILSELTDWAITRWGSDLDRAQISEETYILQGVRLATKA